MYFENYGKLDWLEPTEYYASNWNYLCTAQGEDGENYDIVVKWDYPYETRYTNI